MAQPTLRMTPTEARRAILDGTCPPGATVEGSLRIEREPGLTRLPDGLSVHGGLRIVGCHRLRRPISGLSAQSIEVRSCSAFEGFDGGRDGALRVPGRFDLFDCPSLARLPRALHVEFGLWIERCPWGWASAPGWLPRAPQRLEVVGPALFADCPGLARLPKAMEVGGGLTVRRCPHLRAVGGLDADVRLRIRGDCVIEQCHGLREVDFVDFWPGGDLRVTDCAALERIGDEARPQRCLVVRECPSLSRLPRRLFLDGDLVAHDCPSLKERPQITVLGDILPTGATPRWEAPPTAAEAARGPRRRAPSPGA